MNDTVFGILFHATKLVGQAAGESDESFLLRLVKAIAKLPDNEWDALPLEAQKWYVSAAEALNAKPNPLPIPMCLGFKEITTPKKKASLKNTLKPLKKKKGALHAIRETILQHPSWSNNEVYKHVIQTWPETKPETVAVNGSDIRHTLALAKKLGWKEPSLVSQKVS